MNWIKEKAKKVWIWIIGGLVAVGIISIALAAQPLTPEEMKWKNFTDNLVTIDFIYQGQSATQLRDNKKIWQPTELEFESVYQHTYGIDMVAWQTIDGVEMCPTISETQLGRTACIPHWNQEFNNAKERGIVMGDTIKGLRNGARKNEVNGDIFDSSPVVKGFDFRNFISGLISKVLAVGVEVEDHFLVGSDIALNAHTPDTTGSGYTDLITTGSCDLFVDSVKDNIDAAESITTGGCGAGEGELDEADDVMTTADYTVEITQVNGDTGDDTNDLCGRIADANNMYCFIFNEGSGGPTGDLYENVGGTWAIIEANCGNIADGSKVELIMIGTTISIEDDDSEICSVTDDSHAGPGQAGVGMGDIGADTGDDVSSQELDDFIVTTQEVAGGAVAEPVFQSIFNDDSSIY